MKFDLKKIVFVVLFLFLLMFVLVELYAYSERSYPLHPPKDFDVSMARITLAKAENEDNIKIIKEIELKDSFLADFSELNCTFYRNDPDTGFVGYVIIISYDENNYEYITAYSSRVYKRGKKHYSYCYFDVDEFNRFVESYLQE